MNLFIDPIKLTLVRLVMYSRVGNVIRRDMLMKKANPLTNITSDARVTFLLRSIIAWVISMYSVTNGSEYLLTVLPLREEISMTKIELVLFKSWGVTGQL